MWDAPYPLPPEKLPSAASPTATAAGLLPRPRTAVGTFLRVITVNDVYKLDNYPRVATVVDVARAEAKSLDCVVSAHLNGDFLSPCTLTAIDGGRGMTEGLNQAKFDYVCLGNHEFDFGLEPLAERLAGFKGKCINSNVSNPQLAALPAYDVLHVGDKKARASTHSTHQHAPARASRPLASDAL